MKIEIVRMLWIVLGCMVAIMVASMRPLQVIDLPWPSAWNALIGGFWVLLSVWVVTGVSPRKAIEKMLSVRSHRHKSL